MGVADYESSVEIFKFKISKFEIQFGGLKCKKLLDWDKNF